MDTPTVASRAIDNTVQNGSGVLRKSKSGQVCRFYQSKNGCRAGKDCQFQHVSSPVIEKPDTSRVPVLSQLPEHVSSRPITQPITKVFRPREAVPKPVAAAAQEDPRGFQLTQVARRYKPFRADLEDVTTLKFRLEPSDPDFPFELENGLQCVLNVPADYPNSKPTLSIRNEEMERGFQLNIEKGFSRLVIDFPHKTLLDLLKELDRNLESYLSTVKTATVKFVSNQKKVETGPLPADDAPQDIFDYATLMPASMRYTDQQLKDAKVSRDQQIRQLEARLGRSDRFSKADDGIAFNVPLQITRTAAVPQSLKPLSEAALIVPSVYPLEPCTIILRGVDGPEAENVEIAFETRAESHADLTLMARINYLSVNLAKMAVSTKPEPVVPTNVIDSKPPATSTIAPTESNPRDSSRPHILHIAKPPEWDAQLNHTGTDADDHTDESAEDTPDDSDYELEDTDEDESAPIVGGNTNPERGIQVTLQDLSLSGAELLQIIQLSLAVRCDRCKEPNTIEKIKSSQPTEPTPHSSSCSKCTLPFSIAYRPELLHSNSSKAGYLDILNCTPVSLLPSIFLPTCSTCSTISPLPGLTIAPTTPAYTTCRNCHAKITISFSGPKFLRISSTSISTLPLRSAPRKPKNPLNLTANTPLPSNGACPHYKRSYRWFRFSCCNRVYPCDKCHDAYQKSPSAGSGAHPPEHADRMICGWCSREQRYHPEQCRMCGRSVVKSLRGMSGYWEGGKGTRENVLMRRNEKRKFKRVGKVVEKKDGRAGERSVIDHGRMWWPEEA